MVNVVGVPVHPLAVGVTVMLAVVGDVVELVAVNGPIFPLPVVPKPTSLVDVQEKLVPGMSPLKFIAVPGSPLQYVSSLTGSTAGRGLTVIVTLSEAVNPLTYVTVTV